MLYVIGRSICFQMPGFHRHCRKAATALASKPRYPAVISVLTDVTIPVAGSNFTR